MKKSVRLMALALAAVMMISFCSCSDSGSKRTTSQKETETVTEKPETEETTAPKAASADGTYGELYELMNGVLGKDLASAEAMIGEFFGVELEDGLGGSMTETRRDIETKLHSYSELFAKGDYRFNELQIWTDTADGHVRMLEFTLVNEAYVAYKLENTPELEEEIKKQYEGIKGGLDKTYGDAFDKGNPIYDEDSYYFKYNVKDGNFAYVEIRDFTEEGGNGLLKMCIEFADVEAILEY